MKKLLTFVLMLACTLFPSCTKEFFVPSFDGGNGHNTRGPLKGVIKASGGNVKLYFKYENTKDTYKVLLPAVRGRATCNGEEIATAYREEDTRIAGSVLPDSYDKSFWGSEYSIIFQIPQNKSGARRTVTFEYQYQTNNILDMWSDWILIGTMDQEYQVIY